MIEQEDVMSALERIKRKDAEEAREKDVIERNSEQFRESINKVLETDHGRFVMRVLINKCHVFLSDKNATAAQRVERSILRDLYLTFRPYIDTQHLIELEINHNG